MSIAESIDTDAAVATSAVVPAVGVMTSDAKNRALIAVGLCKYPGLGKDLLITSVLKAMTKGTIVPIMSAETNEEQVQFAKDVWNTSPKDIRKLLQNAQCDWFLSLASNRTLTPVIIAALDKFESSITGSKGTPGGRAAYEEIAQKYSIAKALQQANPGPFEFEQLTPSQERLIAKFEAKQLERDSTPIEQKYPNQNAVTYPFILAKLCEICDCGVHEKNLKANANDLRSKVNYQKKVIQDVLLFLAVHGQKTVAHFNKAVASLSTATGPTCGIDLKPALVKLCKELVKGEDKTEDKLLGNHVLTLKRLIRVVYITTNHPTVWGLMNEEKQFIENIVDLYQKELAVESRDMNSLSMIWYLCIGRANICSVMVDHHELSAANVMARLLGKSGRSGFPKPAHVFPFNKDVTKQFS